MRYLPKHPSSSRKWLLSPHSYIFQISPIQFSSHFLRTKILNYSFNSGKNWIIVIGKMVRPDQEAIETFMSITGVSEAAAIRKLEVVFVFLPLIDVWITLLNEFLFFYYSNDHFLVILLFWCFFARSCDCYLPHCFTVGVWISVWEMRVSAFHLFGGILSVVNVYFLIILCGVIMCKLKALIFSSSLMTLL